MSNETYRTPISQFETEVGVAEFSVMTIDMNWLLEIPTLTITYKKTLDACSPLEMDYILQERYMYPSL